MSEQLEKLKKDWMADPCWDIENTEGFEEDFEELKAFRIQKEAEWKAKWLDKKAAARAQLAEVIGAFGGDAFLDYLLNLERRLDLLEEAESERAANENQEFVVKLYSPSKG